MKGPFRNKGGFSLLEVIVSIALLGLMAAPICSSLVLSFRLNAESEKTLQARLRVESAVERLMAEGIDHTKDYNEDARFKGEVLISIDNDTDTENGLAEAKWYYVAVSDKDGEVTVDTQICAARSAEEVPEE